MPAQPEWTPEQEATLRRLHADGHSYGHIAGVLDCNVRFVAQRAARFGLTPNHGRNEVAIEAVRDKIAGRRIALAEAALSDAINIRERIWDQYTVIANGPNGPERFEMDLPDAKAVREFASAIRDLIRVHEDLERIGKATAADVQKSTLNVFMDNLKAVLAKDNDG